MKPPVLSAIALALTLLASPAAAAPVHEYWIGTYRIQSDGLNALLRIEYSPARCGASHCMWILIQTGEIEEPVVEHVDQSGRNLTLRLASGLRIDAHLVQGAPAIVGTLEWPGNRRGFLAMKQGAAPGGGRGSRSPGGPTPDRVRAITRGAASGPPEPSRGRVRGEREESAGQANAQPLSLPNPPPGTDQDLWLSGLNANLMDGIVRLLRHDGSLVEVYLQEESSTPRTEYGRAYFRADFLRSWLSTQGAPPR